MVILQGLGTEWLPGDDGEDYPRSVWKTIARFSTRELAEQYVQKATLRSFSNGYHRRFSTKSVLGNYTQFNIEEDDIPIDPEI